MARVKRRIGIGHRLTISVVIMLAISISVVGLVFGAVANRAVREGGRALGENEAKHLASEVRGWIEQYELRLETLLLTQQGRTPSSSSFNLLLEQDEHVVGAFFRQGDRMTWQLGERWEAAATASLSEGRRMADPFRTEEGEWLLPIYIPVHNTAGETNGLLGLIVQAQPAMKLLADQVGTAYVVNADSTPVLTPTAAGMMGRIDIVHGSVSNALSSVRQGQTGAVIYTRGSESYLLAYAPVMPGFGLMQEVPLSQAIAAADSMQLLLLGIGSACLLVMGSITYLYSHSLIRPITKLSQATAEIAAGQLRQQVAVTSQDEVGELAGSFNTMVHNLRDLVGRINSTASSLIRSAQDLAYVAQQTGEGTEQVAATIQEVSSGAGRLAEESQHGSNVVDQIAQVSKRMGGQAGQAGQLSQQVKDLADEALGIVDEQSQAAEQAVAAAATAEEKVTELNEYSDRIVQIVAIIEGIAGQTNLLALNAAIEAARAGEQGLGFAVVAEQVRRLAERAGSSTKEIAALIGQVRAGTEQAVAEMAKTREAAMTTRSAVVKTSTTFREINLAIERATREMSLITGEITDLEKQTGEVVSIIHNVSAIAAQSAASSQEVAAAAQQQTSAIGQVAEAATTLTELAEQLQKAVRVFQVD